MATIDNGNMHEISLNVPLSGSKLFDIHSMATAEKLCARFPGLNYKLEEKSICIYGQLNDYWYSEYNKAVFEIGTF